MRFNPSQFTKQSLLLATLRKVSENIVRQCDESGNQECFLPFSTTNFMFRSTFLLLSAITPNLDKCNNLWHGKEINCSCQSP